MSDTIFKSSFAPYIQGLIAEKRAKGLVYDNASSMLRLFDKYCIEKGFNETTLTKELIEDWMILRPGERIRYHSQRITYVRQLANYMKSLEVNTYAPPKLYPTPLPKPKIYQFTSSLAPYIQGLIDEKRSNGYKYESEADILYYFDAFCLDYSFNGDDLSRDLVMAYSVKRPTEGKNFRNKRIVCIRQLSYYMLSLGKEAYTPKTSSSTFTPVPHIMSHDELHAFFYEVDNFSPDYRSKDRMAMAYSIMFRLYYCCGMRLLEVCQLQANDVDLETGRITINSSKGQKDRIVFMASDLLILCRNYDNAVQKYLPNRIWFFTASDETKPFWKTNMTRRFKYFWNKTPYADKVDKQPNIQSLRHTFVVHRINDWMRNGYDFQRLLPYLCAYLGHKTINETHYYYHLTVAAFDIIRKHDVVAANVIPEVLPYEE